MDDGLHSSLTAFEAAKLIKSRKLKSVELVRSCLEKIKKNDAQIRAWTNYDSESALQQSAALDAISQACGPVGSLHGIPVGIKDIVDTKDFPTERGSPIFAGRRPDADAAIIDRLREAGAIVLGKTITTEFAFMNPAETRNPHNLTQTPGGSSSGSAASVAALHVPLAIGTQTNGSVIRPASFCGVFGFKPTRGMIPRTGILETSRSLDQVGVFARTLKDAALLADSISGHDSRDPLSLPRPRPEMLKGCLSEVPVEPVFAFFELPFAERQSEDAKQGVEELLDVLEKRVERLPAPQGFADLVEAHRKIHEFEICVHLGNIFSSHWHLVSEPLRRAVERGRSISESEYENALLQMHGAKDYFTKFFLDYDAVISPSATGEAPPFEDGTGDPIFCTVWTLCGLPTISMPLLVGKSNLPVGVQLVGGMERDDRLLRTARWIIDEIRTVDT
ncbi:MAG: amidase [Albidovulum sp.]|nr:amidase [Albidovulum sp.]MDE0529822.1 amidase [Albidovulum sp.]